MELNKLGEKAEELWNEIPKHYPLIELDYYVIMPNHIHAIIIINKTVETGYIPSPKRTEKDYTAETPCMASLRKTVK